MSFSDGNIYILELRSDDLYFSYKLEILTL